MHTQVLGNLSQAIPIPPIGQCDQLGLLPTSPKQLLQRRTNHLRLSPENVSKHAIWLMMRDKCAQPKIDLSFELIPGPWLFSPVRNKLPIAHLCTSLADTNMSEDPIGREPGELGALARSSRMTAPAQEPWMGHHLGSDRIEDDVSTEFEQ